MTATRSTAGTGTRASARKAPSSTTAATTTTTTTTTRARTTRSTVASSAKAPEASAKAASKPASSSSARKPAVGLAPGTRATGSTASSRNKVPISINSAGDGAGAATPKPVSALAKKAETTGKPSSFLGVFPPGRARAPMKKLKYDPEREPIKAFLRIRPPPENGKDQSGEPYIEAISDTEVVMKPPSESSRARQHASQRCAFTRVFPSSPVPSAVADSVGVPVSQADFFKHTTLPLVQDLLNGESGLVFTYGVTNSGKTYTIQGGEKGEEGLLPRTMDVVFNSIEGLQSSSDIRPIRLIGVERSVPSDPQLSSSLGSSPLKEDDNDSRPPLNGAGVNPFAFAGIRKSILGQAIQRSFEAQHEKDQTSIKVDRNYDYSIWVSYIEIYNERIYDLLDVPESSSSPALEATSNTPTSAARSNGNLPRSFSLHTFSSSYSLATISEGSGTTTVRRNALTLKNDQETGNKYVHGMREVRVRSAEEAHDILRRGQVNRQVFSTLANRASSRSHGIFTVKVIREHKGAPEGDLSSVSTSRLSIVDLAGSERSKNTQTSGDRLKEAGNINKSLMCLGQCMETLRKNQLREKGRKPEMVPFRHSRLTELFQSFFSGEGMAGKAVMIVNVNPYDTGYDENAHVMKFAAVAKSVSTVRTPATFTVPSIVSSAPSLQSKRVSISIPRKALVRQPMRTPVAAVVATKKEAETKNIAQTAEPEEDGDDEVEVTFIEGNESDDGDSDELEQDPFVELLIEQNEELREKLYEARMRAAMIEAETREEVIRQTEERMADMEKRYMQMLMNDAEQNEELMNRKIDLMMQANESVLRRKRGQGEGDSDAESDQQDAEDVDLSLTVVEAPKRSSIFALRDIEEDEEEDQAAEEASEEDSPTARKIGNRILDSKLEAEEGEEDEDEEEEEDEGDEDEDEDAEDDDDDDDDDGDDDEDVSVDEDEDDDSFDGEEDEEDADSSFESVSAHKKRASAAAAGRRSSARASRPSAVPAGGRESAGGVRTSNARTPKKKSSLKKKTDGEASSEEGGDGSAELFELGTPRFEEEETVEIVTGEKSAKKKKRKFGTQPAVMEEDMLEDADDAMLQPGPTPSARSSISKKKF